MRVRRSRRSSTVRAPSWVTPKTSSASVAGSADEIGDEQLLLGEAGHCHCLGQHGRRLGAEAAHQPFVVPVSGQLVPWRGTEQRQHLRDTWTGRQLRAGDRPVDGVLGHLAIGGQLAADHGHHPAAGDQHGVLAGQVGGSGSGVEQRPQSGVRPDDVLAAYVVLQGTVEDAKEEGDVLLRGLGYVGDVAVDLLVGQPDVEGLVGLRKREHETVAGTRHRGHHGAPHSGQGLLAEHDVGAAARPQPDLRHQLPGPHSCSVDHGAGTDGARLPGAGVGERGAVPEGIAHLDPGVHVCAVGGGGAGHREDEAYVVLELAVPGQDRAPQPFTAYDGGEGHRLRDADPAWPGKRLAVGAREQSQHVAGADAAACQGALRATDGRGERHQHRQRAHQVGGGDLHQDAALDGTLVGDVQLTLGQVAQSAVHQLRAPPAGAERHVLGIDGHHVEPAGGGVERNTGAGDAEPDHQHVGGLGDVGEADLDLPGGHGRRNRSTRWPSSVSKALTSASRDGVPASHCGVGHRVRGEREAVAGQHQRAREQVGFAVADRAVPLALADQSREARGEVVLAASAAVEQVGQQHLGVEVDDPPQQLVGAQATDRRDDPRGDPVQRVRGRVE